MYVEIMKEDAWVYEDKTGRLELIKKPSLDISLELRCQEWEIN